MGNYKFSPSAKIRDSAAYAQKPPKPCRSRFRGYGSHGYFALTFTVFGSFASFFSHALYCLNFFFGT